MVSGPRRIRRRLCALLLALMAIPSPLLASDWSPVEEPEVWRIRRDRLLASGRLPAADWVYMDSMGNERLEAGEYLSGPSRSGDVVTFEAAVLLRRTGERAWTVRSMPMRARCDQGVLERGDGSGGWGPYPDRPDTAVKVRWICRQP
tara:strand:+ start:166 stop:606 length:441 start_codon:yes stop_codon:yes gene_type:complete